MARTDTTNPDVLAMLREHIEHEETKFDKGEDRMERIENDLRPIAKMYNAFMGASAVLTFLITVLIWVYMGDRDQLRQQGDAIIKQGFVIEKMILKHEELEKDLKRDVARVEREVERLHK